MPDDLTPCDPRRTTPMTLHAALDLVAAASPGQTVHFPDEGEALTVAELAVRSRCAAAVLADRGVAAGATVGLLSPNAPEFLVGLFGIVRAGAAAAPLALPMGADLADWATRLRASVAAAGIRHVVVSGRIAERLAPALVHLGGVEVLHDAELDRGTERAPGGEVPVEGTAIVQFTSGSTARPKGVVLTHANVWHCARSITEAIALDRTDVHGSWLPLFHDMGLFGALTGLFRGIPLHLWSPAGFVRRPERWLAAFARSGATIATMPNFGYDTLVTGVDAESAAALDLSAWRVAFNGAEAVSADALEAFLARFAPAGFRPGAMVPAYGMAEATLVATLPPPGRAPVLEHVDRDRLVVQGRAVPVDPDGPGARALVGLGRAVADMAVRTARRDGADGLCADGEVGEIQLQGAMVTSGYLGGTGPELFTADGWLRSGDLGYLRDGELFFTGRIKEMITVAGRNLYAADVEDVAREVSGVHRGRCVAVGGSRPDGGEVVDLVVETTATGEAADALTRLLRERAVAALGALPLTVHLVAPRSIPRTTSGKVRRLDVRARLRAAAPSPSAPSHPRGDT